MVSENSRITFLRLFVTTSCNLSCSYCYQKNRRDNDLIPLDTVTRTLNWWIENASGDKKTLHLVLFGGEPLLHPDHVLEIARKARSLSRRRSKRMKLTLSTNGTLLTEPMIDRLSEFDMGIRFSIDGDTETQAHNRKGNGRWQYPHGFEKIVTRLARSMPNAIARMTVSPDRSGVLFKDFRYLTALGFRRFVINPAYFTDWAEKDLDLLDEAFTKIADHYVDALANGPPVYVSFLDNSLRSHFGGIPESGSCGAARNMLAVDTNGDFYPCQYFVTAGKGHSRFRLGNPKTGIRPTPLAQYHLAVAGERRLLGITDEHAWQAEHRSFCPARCLFMPDKKSKVTDFEQNQLFTLTQMKAGLYAANRLLQLAPKKIKLFQRGGVQGDST